MSLVSLFNHPGAYHGHFIAWTLVVLVGLMAAIGRKRLDRRVRWTAIAAFVVLLLPCGHVFAPMGSKLLAGWVNTIPFAVQLEQAVGFALLTVAIFIGRRERNRIDPTDRASNAHGPPGIPAGRAVQLRSR